MRDALAGTPQTGTREADLFPLSAAQQRLWLLSEFTEYRAAATLTRTYRVRGTVDAGRLQRALDYLVQRHDCLRTSVVSRGDVVAQRIAAEGHWPLAVMDVNAGGDPQGTASQRASADAAAEFDLESGPLVSARLIRAGDDQALLVLRCHRLVVDEQSMDVLLAELTARFTAAMAGGTLGSWSCRRWQSSSLDLAVWQQSMSVRDRRSKAAAGVLAHRARWCSAAGRAADRPAPPAGGHLRRHPPRPRAGTRYGRRGRLLSRQRTEPAISWCWPPARAGLHRLRPAGPTSSPERRHRPRGPPRQTLSGRSRQRLRCAWTPRAIRDSPISWIGCAVPWVTPTTIRMCRSSSWCRSCGWTVTSAVTRCSRSWSTLRRTIRGPLTLGPVTLRPESPSRRRSFTATSPFSFSSHVGGLRLSSWTTRIHDLFEVGSVVGLVDRLVGVLVAGVGRPWVRLSGLPVLVAGERSRLLSWGGVVAGVRRGDAGVDWRWVGVSGSGGGVWSDVVLTYRELWERAGWLAGRIGLVARRGRGWRSGWIVRRCWWWRRWRCGGRGVGMCRWIRRFPRQRLRVMVDDADVAVVLADVGSVAWLPVDDRPVITVDAAVVPDGGELAAGRVCCGVGWG